MSFAMKRKTKNKPSLAVVHNPYGRGIRFDNIFEFAQVEAMLAGLRKLKKKLDRAYGKDDGKFQKFVEGIVWDKTRRKKKYTPDELVEMELRHKCMYYFWSKCEYEVMVTGWPDTNTERKIDIYQQLDANWELFKKMAFEVIG